MLIFVRGFGLVQLVVVSITLAASRSSAGMPPGSAPFLLLALFAIPTGAAWLAGAAMNRVSPRSIFDARVRRPWACFLLGVVSAAAATIPMTFLVSVLADYLPDAAATAICGGASAAVAVLLLARRRQGTCVHCSYDLEALPEAAACPECGAFGSG